MWLLNSALVSLLRAVALRLRSFGKGVAMPLLFIINQVALHSCDVFGLVRPDLMLNQRLQDVLVLVLKRHCIGFLRLKERDARTVELLQDRVLVQEVHRVVQLLRPAALDRETLRVAHLLVSSFIDQ